jgi:hypothetical protein
MSRVHGGVSELVRSDDVVEDTVFGTHVPEYR